MQKQMVLQIRMRGRDPASALTSVLTEYALLARTALPIPGDHVEHRRIRCRNICQVHKYHIRAVFGLFLFQNARCMKVVGISSPAHALDTAPPPDSASWFSHAVICALSEALRIPHKVSACSVSENFRS